MTTATPIIDENDGNVPERASGTKPGAAAPAASEPRSEKDLILATKPFAVEDRGRSWWYLLSTFAVLGALLAGAVLAPYAALRFVAAVLAGLTIVRVFIIYHDVMHGAMLRGSFAARALLYPYALLVMTPPLVWRETHNYHHAHTAKIVGSHVGSYAMTTPQLWARMTPRARLMYRIVRHPVTILFGYFTIFMYGMCLSPLLRSPRKAWDSGLSLVASLGLGAVLVATVGWATFFYAYFLPVAVATASGAYLFYAQHNFPGVNVQRRDRWSYARAALESSSFMKTGPVMGWFTGNIGYHHVHHLNPQIPFYRLPEAMAAIPELQTPPVTSLSPRDVVACFKLKLWDPDAGKMVGYP